MRIAKLAVMLALVLAVAPGCFLFAPIKGETKSSKQAEIKTSENHNINGWMKWGHKSEKESSPHPPTPVPALTKEQREALKKAGVSDKLPVSSAASQPAAKPDKPEVLDLSVDGKSVVKGTLPAGAEVNINFGSAATKNETVKLTFYEKLLSKAKESYTWIILGSFAVIGLGVFVALQIHKLAGISISLAGLVVLTLAITLRDAPIVFIFGGLLLIGGIIAFAVWFWLKHKNETAATATSQLNWAALKETVAGVDNAKADLVAALGSEEAQKIIDILHDALGDSQDKVSKKAVDQAQAEIKAKV